MSMLGEKIGEGATMLESGASALQPHVRRRLGLALRGVYEHISVATPLPDDHLDLLLRLRHRDRDRQRAR